MASSPPSTNADGIGKDVREVLRRQLGALMSRGLLSFLPAPRCAPGMIDGANAIADKLAFATGRQASINPASSLSTS